MTETPSLLSPAEIRDQFSGRLLLPLQELMKMNAAWKTAEMIKERQPASITIGSGSTSKKVVQAIGKLIEAGRISGEMAAVATSSGLSELAIQVGLTKTQEFNTTRDNIISIREGRAKPEKTIDFGFDGADKIKVLVDDRSRIIGFYSIKGGGGAHTIEKIIDQMAKELVFVVDESKIVGDLGESFYLPIEVTPNGLAAVQHRLLTAYNFSTVDIKKDEGGRDFETDLKNRVLMAKPNGIINDPKAMEQALLNDPEIKPYLIDTGFFLSVQPSTVLVACKNGEVLQLNIGDVVGPDHPFAQKILKIK